MSNLKRIFVNIICREWKTNDYELRKSILKKYDDLCIYNEKTYKIEKKKLDTEFKHLYKLINLYKCQSKSYLYQFAETIADLGHHGFQTIEIGRDVAGKSIVFEYDGECWTSFYNEEEYLPKLRRFEKIIKNDKTYKKKKDYKIKFWGKFDNVIDPAYIIDISGIHPNKNATSMIKYLK